MAFKVWSDYTAAGNSDFILYLGAKFSDSFYADFFVVLFTEVNGEQQVGDQAGQYLGYCDSDIN